MFVLTLLTLEHNISLFMTWSATFLMDTRCINIFMDKELLAKFPFWDSNLTHAKTDKLCQLSLFPEN